MEGQTLKAALEAILMVCDRPVDVSELVHALQTTDIIDSQDDSGVGEQIVSEALDDLRKEYQEQKRGFELFHGLQGWQLMSAQEYEQVVAHFIADGQSSHLSQAALEALAVIAYKQPITRAQVTSIRGVNSDGVIRSLVVRGLVREQGSDEQTHAAFLTTTGLFLDKMGLSDVAQLPELAPFLPQSVLDEDKEGVL